MLMGALSEEPRNSLELGRGWFIVLATYAEVESCRGASLFWSVDSWFLSSVSTCSAITLSQTRAFMTWGGETYAVELPKASRILFSARSFCGPRRMRNRVKASCRSHTSVLRHRSVISSFDTAHKLFALVCLPHHPSAHLDHLLRLMIFYPRWNPGPAATGR